VPALPPPIPFRFETPTPLRWVDVDSEGVVNNAVYLSLFEQARYDYFARLSALRDGNIAFVLAEATTTFLRPGRLGMGVVTRARVRRLGRTSFDMDFESLGDGETLVRGKATLVWVDKDLRPAPIDAAARRAIAAFEGIAEGPVP
jgi:acyl-CoA thioester hydrolase